MPTFEVSPASSPASTPSPNSSRSFDSPGGSARRQNLLNNVEAVSSGNGTARICTIAVAVKAHEKMRMQPFAYALQLVEQRNCKVAVICCMTKVRNELGVDLIIDDSFGGVSKKKLDSAIKTHRNHLSYFLEPFRKVLEQKGIELEINISSGRKSDDILVQEAKTMQPHWVVLDVPFSGSQKRIQAALECNLVLLNKNPNKPPLRLQITPKYLGAVEQSTDQVTSEEFLGPGFRSSPARLSYSSSSGTTPTITTETPTSNGTTPTRSTETPSSNGTTRTTTRTETFNSNGATPTTTTETFNWNRATPTITTQTSARVHANHDTTNPARPNTNSNTERGRPVAPALNTLLHTEIGRPVPPALSRTRGRLGFRTPQWFSSCTTPPNPPNPTSQSTPTTPTRSGSGTSTGQENRSQSRPTMPTSSRSVTSTGQENRSQSRPTIPTSSRSVTSTRQESPSTTSEEIPFEVALAMAIEASMVSASEQGVPVPPPAVDSSFSTPPAPSAPPLPLDGPNRYPYVDTSPAAQINYGSAAQSTESLPTKRDKSCVVCWDAPAEAVCIPCGHVAGCKDCLTEIKSKKWGCPVCRASIMQVIKVYTV